MPTNDWLRTAMGVGLVCTLSIILGVLSLGLALNGQSNLEIGRHCSPSPTQCDKVESTPITALPAVAQGESITQQPKWWERGDLDAQRQMARWTTIIGVLTGGGIVLLGWTLWETRRVTVETRRIGKVQTRAYLAGVRAWVEEFQQEGFYCYIEIENFGQSPAVGIEVKMRAQYNVTAKGAETCTEKIHYNNSLTNHPRTLAPRAKARCAIYINRSFVDSITAQEPREIRFYIMADVWWLDVYQDEQHTRITVSQALGAWSNNQPVGEMQIHGSEPNGSYHLRH